jgi:small-conductance mechanosensitive channel
VDSILKIVAVEIDNKKDSLVQELPKMTHRVLRVNKVEWNNYRTYLKKYQIILKDRSEEISNISNEITDEIKIWDQTKRQLVNSSDSNEVYSGLDQIIETLQDILNIAHTRLDDVFIIQKGITQMVLNVDEMITEIELAEVQMQKNYFVFDSEPIWKSRNIGLKAIDSTKTNTITLTDQIFAKVQVNKNQLKEFLSLNSKTAILQGLFLLILLAGFVRIGSKWKGDARESENQVEKQLKIILRHPISATIVVGLLISVFFYDSLNPAFAELHIILILIGTVILLPKITTKQFSQVLILILLAYLLQVFEVYLNHENNIVRSLIIVDAIILIIALLRGRVTMSRSPQLFKPIYKLFNSVSLVYIVILSGAIIANIIGMVSLSRFLVFGVLISTALGMVIFLAVKIVTSLVILFFRFRNSYSIQTLSTMVTVTNKRIKPVLNLVGLLVWIVFSLKGFEMFNILSKWFNELMIIHWEVGEMTISLGGILSFLGIFILSLFLAKLAATIFQDEWMVKALPRGVAPAVSLLLRIFLIGIGLYMALSAAGLDLSKLGFMVGALGVGIGFGLQNVVLNFVAGLILAFERPINLGDTIEIDQEFGIVTSIGVRSSSIKSYSGYEAIIPNGDLISKKVINYTLTNRDRRSKIIMKTAPTADPEKVIALFNEVAAEHPNTHRDPEPKTYFYGYDVDGNLSFSLLYWTTFSDTLETDNAIALKIFTKLKEEGIQPPAPVRRIIKED